MRPLARFAGSGHLPARKPRGRVLGLPRGSPIARVPLPISCDVLPAREGSDAFPSVETARLHHAAGRPRGRMLADVSDDESMFPQYGIIDC